MRSAVAVVLSLLVTFLAGCGVVTTSPAVASNGAPVILLHGLGRSASSMHRMEVSLRAAGYRVCNIDYPSREHAIAVLAEKYVGPKVAECMAGSEEPPNFVTHSLGGIVVRQLAATGEVRNFGRVVMLGPPNHGSEVVDSLGSWELFKAINGPAGNELGASAGSVPLRLGPAPFQVGIIAGSRSINWILSLIIPGQDDGKVSVENAKLEGMRDFVVVPTSHPFLMTDRKAIEQTIQFLSHGCFQHKRGDVLLSLSKGSAGMTHARAAQGEPFKRCCLRSKLYDGSERDHYF